MPKVEMYTTPYCPFCIRAKRLLESKNVSYHNIDVGAQPQLRREMIQKSGRHTVPQIWVGETHVGGFDDLWALDRQGQLDKLLELAPAQG